MAVVDARGVLPEELTQLKAYFLADALPLSPSDEEKLREDGRLDDLNRLRPMVAEFASLLLAASTASLAMRREDSAKLLRRAEGLKSTISEAFSDFSDQVIEPWRWLRRLILTARSIHAFGDLSSDLTRPASMLASAYVRLSISRPLDDPKALESVNVAFAWRDRSPPSSGPARRLTFGVLRLGRLVLLGRLDDATTLLRNLKSALTSATLSASERKEILRLYGLAELAISQEALPDPFYSGPGAPVRASGAKAMEAVMASVAAMPIEEWRRSRAPEIAAVAKAPPGGENAPELAEEAIAQRIASAEEIEKAKREVEALRISAKQAAEERDRAARRVAALEAETSPQLGGWGRRFRRSWRRVAKQVRRTASPVSRVAKGAVREVKSVRNQIARRLVPASLRDLGKAVENETNRLGRRVNREAIRTVTNIATKYGPLVRIGLTLFGYAIGLGPLAAWLATAAVSSVEITYAKRMEREALRQWRKARVEILRQIEQMKRETAALLARIADLEAKRAALIEVVKRERQERSAEIAGELRRARVMQGAAGLIAFGATAWTLRKRAR